MAYQNQGQSRPYYDQRGPPRRGPPPQGYEPQFNNNYQRQQQPPPQQQQYQQQQPRARHNRGQPSEDGYYHSEFWAEYGVPPLQNNGFDQGPPQQDGPQMRAGNFSRPNGFDDGSRGPPPGQFGNGDPRQRGPPNGYGMNGPPQGFGNDGFNRGPPNGHPNGRPPPRGDFRGGPGGPGGPQGMRQSPPRRAQGMGPPYDPSLKMGFDNPFPIFPSNPPPRSATAPLENGMGNMSINGRPSIDSSSRPPTSASRTSNRSTPSRQSERSQYSTDATTFDSIQEGPLTGPSSFQRGPLPRSMTTPNDRPPTRPGGPMDFGIGPLGNDPMGPRAGSAAGMRPGMGGFGPPVRAQTSLDNRPGTSQGKNNSFDDWMPNFDGPSNAAPMEDAIGLPLDAAPGIARAPTAPPQLHAMKSQPNLRLQDDGLGFGFDQPPPMPGGMPMNGNRMASPDPYSSRSRGPGGPGPRANMPPPSMQGQGRPSLDTQQNPWSDPGPGRGGPMSAPPGGPPGGGFRGPPPGRMNQPPPPQPENENPDALPAHPMPVRPGLMDNAQAGAQSQRGPPQRIPQQAGEPTDGEPPVTLRELDELREKARVAPADNKLHLFLARKLVEASNVLADEGGRADLKTRNKNRERYVFEAHKVIKRLVQQSYPDAMFYLADCYGTGQLGLQVDHKEAFNLYQAAAKLGHPASAYRTAVCCEIGGEGTRKDPLKAVQWYRRSATLGDVSAMYKLGMVLLKGLLGQQLSVGEGVIWLNRAAERADEENPHAVHELALIHEFPPRGGKIIADEKYALQLYQQAAKLGYRLSQTRLGKAFEQGHLGCPIDDRASIHWYSKAAAQEDGEAELALSGWYLTGSRGILEASETEAYLWARKAALKEYPKAEYAMGHFSETGIGCPVNLEDAKRWYGRAASHHYVKAQEALENLRRGGRQRIKRQRYSRTGRNDECSVM
ncbi:hypothetical protein BT63DRAFT_260334 [Microthyrium microscopicum]|uniref:HCP-like protein n=1 Tax=Microthyrium microscopicum TaxID=703497 RepID=A0A6A6UAV2_9PEZI|nr:hypothetical protein BT63DRAFT_260334 [Microthyrium microscopicum]